MGRIEYSEEEDFAGQFELWQANCHRSMQGKKGQAVLREMETALLALPSKRLITGNLVDPHGEVCAIGALAQSRGEITDNMIGQGEYDMEGVGITLGMPRLVAWKIVSMNDMELTDSELVFPEGPYRWPSERPHVYLRITPERLYERMLGWVQSQIVEGEALIQSYVKGRWFVSTIYRQSSAALNPDGWYYETMVWDWNAERREREPNFIAQYDSGLTEPHAMAHHLSICQSLPHSLTSNEE